MFSLFLACAPEGEDQLSAELWEAGTAGIVEEPGGLRAFFEPGADRAALAAHFAPFSPQPREEPATDWERVSRDAFPPLAIGARWFLAAPWSDARTPAGRIRLEIAPGMACGTGRHPATQLCLAALEGRVRPGCAVADVGCGSGILAVAAGLLGAGAVVSCDIDPEAVAIARERLDGPIFVGSAGAIRDGFADLVIANISSAAIEELRPEFERIRRPGSALLLAGFTESDAPAGFAVKETLRQDEWVCLIC